MHVRIRSSDRKHKLANLYQFILVANLRKSKIKSKGDFMPIRQPIISILGHVDHGKTTLLDYIRTSRVAVGEAGGITQHIGASEVPEDSIKKTCAEILSKLKIDVKIPGLLFIDTPGHAAFSLLRKRGGALADIAVLVVDITEGLMPQTDEAISILKQNKTPFIVAANKVDKISAWIPKNNSPFHHSFDAQPKKVREDLDQKIYELIGTLYERGISADRFDRISDFTKAVAIVPLSGRTGEGVCDLLAIITGLSQKYLEKKLQIDEKGPGRGTVLEVKEVKGLGTTIDIILYDGMIMEGDQLIIGARETPIATKVKSILKTMPLKELRVEKKFNRIPSVVAAAGIKVSALGIEDAIAGMPVIALRPGQNSDEAKEAVKKDVESIEIETAEKGVIIRADALGSLEAIVRSIKEKNVPIRKALIGTVSRKDVLEMKDMDENLRAIFAFNANVAEDAREEAKIQNVSIIENDVIYRLLEDYDKHVEAAESEKKKALCSALKRPAKVKFLHGFVFRQSKPAVIGMEILLGKLVSGARLMKADGNVLGAVEQIQDKGINISEASAGMKAAVSVDGFVVGRNVKEGDVFCTFLTKEEYQMLKKNIGLISETERQCLGEIRQIMVKKDVMWDVG